MFDPSLTVKLKTTDMKTDLKKEHIYIDGKAINKNVAKHADEMLDVLKDLRDGDYQLYGEAWAQIDRAIKKATL